MNTCLNRVCKCLLLLLLPTVLLTACVAPQQYRNDYMLCTSRQPIADCPSSSIQQHKDPTTPDQEYLMGIIEFDDQGQLWDRQQLRAVLDQFAVESHNQEFLVVVFVHGWKHNAEAGDGNIQSFRDTLKRLSAMESSISRQSGTAPRRIAGVFLGWRGRSISAPILKELTFWDRKNTAHKVGYGGTTEVLSRLEMFRNTKHEIARQDDRLSNTRLVVVGHSFGGAVIYSALSEILENGFVQTQGPIGLVSNTVGFADLVVLINPAFEALKFANLSDMSIERTTYFPGQLPVLAVLTSEADYATKYAFPVGRFFSTMFEQERNVPRYNPVIKQEEIIDQGEANIKTIGHFDGYNTHYLKADDSSSEEMQTGFDLSSEVASYLVASDRWEKDYPGSKIQFYGSTLQRINSSAGRNPYLNILVDKELIEDHGDINDPRIESFVRQLILIASQSPELENRKQLRSKALNP